MQKGGIPLKGNPVNSFFTLVQTSEMIGPTTVNVMSMVVPRTVYDFTRRGPEAGTETGRREVTAVLNNSMLPGIYALGIGWLLGQFGGVNGTIPLNNSEMEFFHKAWQDSKGNLNKYIEISLTNAKVCRDGKPVSLLAEGVAGKDTTIDTIKKYFDDVSKVRDKKEIKKRLKAASSRIVKTTGSEQSILLDGTETTATKFVKGMERMYREVLSKKNSDEILKKMKSLCKNRTIAGLAIAASLGVATQYLNRHLTKLKTGTDAFVGLPDYDKIIANKSFPEEKKKKSGFGLILAKAVSVATMGYLLAASLKGTPRPQKAFKLFFTKDGLEELGKKLQFKGRLPSLDQLKVLAAVTYTGRILASADGNELRETDTRDMLGFLNWLVFGGFVTKLLANKYSKEIMISKTPEQKGSSRWGRIKHTIMHKYLMSEGEIKAICKAKGLPDTEFKKLMAKRNLWLGAGIAYSTLVLGIAIPVFNKWLTNKIVGTEGNTAS
ncbi:MAG: hypothetical protein GX568_01720, partial [Candidatus Gastranaerophilales bacterium]|nr:hypothetical protein [Candidatus Gastranaerophilales bacterium]